MTNGIGANMNGLNSGTDSPAAGEKLAAMKPGKAAASSGLAESTQGLRHRQPLVRSGRRCIGKMRADDLQPDRQAIA